MEPQKTLTPKQGLIVDHMCFKRCFELLEEQMHCHVEMFDQLNGFDQFYLIAYWSVRWKRFIEAVQDEPLSLPVSTKEDFDKATMTIDEHFGTSVTKSNQCVDTVKKRLETTKRIVGDKFANAFRQVVNRHEISSPIEQVFLMEWKCAAVDDRLGVDLEPQAEIKTDAGTFHVDFLITSKSTGELGAAIAIELDGHEFHERTPDQVARDNKRTRAITKAGITVLRFSGREVLGRGRECVKEVVEMIERTKQ